MILENVNQQTREAYNLAAEKYNDLFFDELDKKEFDRSIFDEFASYFNSDSIVCDAGCGPCGHVAKYFSDKNINIIGIDISEKCIEIAKKNQPELSFIIGDFSKLSFVDNYFDGIISYYSLIDTPKQYAANVLNEFKRVLKSGGYLLLVVKEGSSEGFQNELLGLETEIYFSLFTVNEIQLYLSTIGMKDIKTVSRAPYLDEIQVNRIFSISQKL